jgi:hypothetical protein
MTTVDLQRILAAVTIAGTLVLGGCASTTPNVDARFGQAVLAARAQQTINPAASLNPDQVKGIDGRAAREAMTGYYESFKTPPPTFNVINIGGAMSGSSSTGQ